MCFRAGKEPMWLGEQQKWGTCGDQITKGLVCQCEGLGLEGGEKPLEDSAWRDINELRILQNFAGYRERL